MTVSSTFTPAPHPQDGRTLSNHFPRSIERIAAEHKARGLLQLIELVTRCLECGAGTEKDVEPWARAVADAQEELAILYRAGLPRGFHHPPVAGTGQALEKYR